MGRTSEDRDGGTVRPEEDSPRRSWRRADIGAVLFLALLPGGFFLDVLAGSGRFYVRDVTRFYYPVKSVLARIVRNGEFPWWNPFYAGGQPIAANPEYSIFYPPQWLIFLPNFDLGFRLHILVHLSIGLVSMYVLLRSLRLSTVPSIYGAIAWGMGGVVLSSLNLLPILFVAAWMPLFLFALNRSLRIGTAGSVALAGAIGGIQVLAGEPTTLIQTWLLASAVLAWWVFRGGATNKARSLTIFVAILAMSILIGAVQLFPAMDHARDTVRGRGLSVDLITHWSFPPGRLVELVQPFYFGFHNVAGRVIWWGSEMYPRASSPFIMNLFSGALIVPLILAGLWVRGTRRLSYLGVALPFLILSLGGRLPAFEWMVAHGVALPIRFPEKLVLGAVFASVVYASYVLDRGLSGERRVLRSAFCIAAALTAVLLTGWIVMSTGRGATSFLESRNLAPVLITESAVDLVARGWMLSAVFMCAGAVILYGVGRRSRVWRFLLIAALCAEMLFLSVDVAPRMAEELFEPPAIVGALPDERDEWRLFHEADWYGNRFFTNGDPGYWELRNGLYPLVPGAWGYSTVLQRDYDLTQLLPTVDLAEAMWRVRDAGQEEWREIFMRLSNARVRLSLAERPPAEVVFNYPWLIEPVDIQDIGPVARYYFASELRHVADLDELVESLATEVPPGDVAFVTEIEPFEPADGIVRGARESSSSVSIDVVARGKSFLVLANTYHRYWKATVDGEPARIVPANIGYQGIVIGPGEHEIRLEYRNPVVTGTAPFSAAALLLVIAVLSFPSLRRRRLFGSGSEASPADA